jgi:PAS domain S-box-containing protein
VEDEGLVAADVQRALERGGYEVCGVCADGASAVREVRRELPDAVIMDIQLSGPMDGIEAAGVIQRECGRPVIFLTGHAEAATVQRARGVQPYGYLLKPFHESELQSAVELAVSRHAADSRVRESEERFSGALRSIAGAVICTDILGVITFLNPVAEAITGWRAAEAVGRQLHEVFRVVLPDGEALRGPGLVQATGGSGALRTIFLTARDGSMVAIEDHTNPIRDASGALTGIVILFRRREGVPLPDNLPPGGVVVPGTPWPNLAGIVGSIADPLLAMDADWKITYLNEAAARLLQGEVRELPGKIFWDCLPATTHRRYYQEFAATLDKQSARSFEMRQEAEGRWHEVQLYPYGDGLLALFHDITARREAEEQQDKIEKLESLGLLARGFAHDFNNLLTVLLGNLSLAENALPAGWVGRTELERARVASLQAQNLVQQLLTFARGGAPIRQPLEAHALLREWFAEWPKRGDRQYRIDGGPGEYPVEWDRHQIRRVLSNLLKNAEQATRPGGQIALRLGRPGEPGFPEGELGLPGGVGAAGSWAVIEVSDDGEGIAPGQEARVFEPYFTTRAEANASGLGLTVCESVARAHGGVVRILSSPGTGTRVRLALPGRSVAGESVAAAPSPPPERRKRVLLLEDEPLILQLLEQHLLRCGCESTATMDGAETIARYREAMESGQRYDLVILDLSIPGGMGGAAAMETIRRMDPAVRAVVSSGYSDDPVMSRYIDYGFHAVLPKPYQPQDLMELVRGLLSDAP